MTSRLHEMVADAIAGTNADDWRRIAAATDLSFSWIKAFAAGRIPNPSASRLETLYEALKGKPIKIEG